jgi:hypothetical protein
MMKSAPAAPSYVVLTSKPGLYRSEADAGVEILETYDYLFYGKTKAIFQIARLARQARIRVVEDAPPHVANLVPTRVMEQFASLEDARRAVAQLASFGSLDAALVQR